MIASLSFWKLEIPPIMMHIKLSIVLSYGMFIVNHVRPESVWTNVLSLKPSMVRRYNKQTLNLPHPRQNRRQAVRRGTIALVFEVVTWSCCTSDVDKSSCSVI
jgi:hypothetical protein